MFCCDSLHPWGKRESLPKSRQEKVGNSLKYECIATGRRHGYGFFRDGRERLIAEDISLLPYTTEEAGGFVGCTIGMYASANGQDSSNYADFAWFVQNAI